jgi:hypothetical protein
MQRRFSRASIALAFIATGTALSGCATVTRGTHEAWTVNTVPPNASIRTSNGRACDATPCTFTMNHRETFDVTITKPGFKDWHGHVTHEFSTGGGVALAGNVLVGGLVGLTVDAASGATQKLVPNPLTVTLEPVAAAAAAPPPPATPANTAAQSSSQ